MLIRQSNLRFPGVSFVPPAPAASVGLPPLDVAGFVGFAERGPLDWPVALGDASEFRAIFGGELALARDEGGRTIYAQLPQAVATFFTNGGRRCYAVRVAGPAARPASFALPGVLALSEAGRPRLAVADAANPGRWASGLRLSARLMIAPLPRDLFTVVGPLTLSWRTAVGAALATGDLLRLTGADGRRWLAPIAAITAGVTARTLELAGAWELLRATAPELSAAPVAASRLLAVGVGPELAATLVVRPGALTVELAGPEVARLALGDGLRLRLADGAELVTFVTALRQLRPGGAASVERAEVTVGELLRLARAGLQLESPPGPPRQIERLRLDLLPRLGLTALPTISNLALNAGHPRFWGEQILLESSLLRGRSPTVVDPTEERAAARAARAFRRLVAGLRPDPRDGAPESMALAALLAPLDDAAAALTYLPLATAPVVAASDAVGPLEPGTDDLAALEAGHFLDGELAAAGRRGPHALLAEVRERYDVQERRIYGLHSLITLPEVATLCAPDAAQRPWNDSGPIDAPPPPPALPAPAPMPCPELLGPFEDCLRQPRLSAVSPAFGPIDGGTAVLISGSGFALPGPLTVRFDGRSATDISVENDGALRCRTPRTGAADSVDVTVNTGGGEGRLADAFIYQAAPTAPELPTLEPSAQYDLSATPLLAVQRALIDICRARGDAVALLSLPAHFERRDCVLWQERLRVELGLSARRGPGDGGQVADLSFAAVYHPWLLVRDDSAPDRVRAIPCDGAVAGLIAARERERGVWVAPANAALQGVLGLTPTLGDDDWAELYALQLNLVRAEPRDFRPMSAHTLSDERSLLQLSVRRLLILLRKAAEEHGMDFVFERNHEHFRQGVRALLEAMLGKLYDGGAFAGATNSEAYRVLTDASVNPPQSVEQGRFVASIEVAPSQPAEFISVLLTRGDAGQIRATES